MSPWLSAGSASSAAMDGGTSSGRTLLPEPKVGDRDGDDRSGRDSISSWIRPAESGWSSQYCFTVSPRPVSSSSTDVPAGSEGMVGRSMWSNR